MTEGQAYWFALLGIFAMLNTMFLSMILMTLEKIREMLGEKKEKHVDILI